MYQYIHKNFNSIKVQLRLAPYVRMAALIFNFNSIKVQLRHAEGNAVRILRPISIP